MDDDTAEQLSNGLLNGESYGLLWPRLIYGRLLRELSIQGAKAIVFFHDGGDKHAPREPRRQRSG